MRNKLDYQIMRLPIGILKVDRYQKKLRKKVIDGIVKNFDPIALGLIHVSLRSDGTYWIFDGQNRTEAMKIRGEEFIDCLVFTGLTFEQEASGFVGHHHVSKPTKIEEHNGRLLAKEKDAIEIEKIVNSLGLRIVAGGMKDTIQSVTTLYEIYEKNGSEILTDVLAITKESFREYDRPFSVPILKSLRDILVNYGKLVDKKWMIKRMSESGFNELNIKADGFSRIYGFSKLEGMKMAITQCYNHRKSERLKLK